MRLRLPSRIDPYLGRDDEGQLRVGTVFGYGELGKHYDTQRIETSLHAEIQILVIAIRTTYVYGRSNVVYYRMTDLEFVTLLT